MQLAGAGGGAALVTQTHPLQPAAARAHQRRLLRRNQGSSSGSPDEKCKPKQYPTGDGFGLAESVHAPSIGVKLACTEVNQSVETLIFVAHICHVARRSTAWVTVPRSDLITPRRTPQPMPKGPVKRSTT